MAITKKPRALEKQTVSEADIQALIEKGGSIAKEGKKKSDNDNGRPQLVQLRLEREVVHRIDEVLQSRLVKVPRHTWFLEAVYEKLSREEAES